MDVSELATNIFTEALNNKNNLDKSSITPKDSDKTSTGEETKTLCKYCNKSLSKLYISFHIKICSKNPQKTNDSSNYSKSLCKFCKKSYTKSKINRHQNICSDNPQKNYASAKFRCDICTANYSRKDNLNAHIKKCKARSSRPQSGHTSCLYNNCTQRFTRKAQLIEHLKVNHKCKIKNPQELNFTSLSEFEKWKEEKEEKTFSYFTKQNGSKNGKAYYYCQHDGHPKPHRNTGLAKQETSRKRSVDQIKKGRVCTAMIRLVVKDDGSCVVKYFPTHSHPLSIKDWKHQPQKKSVYKCIDQQIALNIPPLKILQNIKQENISLTGKVGSQKSELITENLIRKRKKKFCRNASRDHEDHVSSTDIDIEQLIDENLNQVAVYLGILDVQPEETHHSKMMNFNNDLHICGLCRKIFSDIQLFLEHKQKCFIIEKVDTVLPTTDCILLENGHFPDQTIFKLPVLQSEAFPLNLYCVNEEVVGDSIPLESQDEISVQDQLTEVWTTGQTISEINEEDEGNKLVEVVSNEGISRNELNDETIGENFRPEQTNESEIPASNENCKVEVAEEFIEKKKTAKKCNICNFATFHPRDFFRHMRKHSGDRPYQCCYCDKMFTRQDKLAIHKRIHLGDKRFKCQVCEYATADSGALRRHSRIHTGERPFQCQLCPYRARDASHITVHLRTHTGDSPFFCQLSGCSRTFKTSTDLRRHQKDHKNSCSSSLEVSCNGTTGQCSHGRLPKEKVGKIFKTFPCYGCQNNSIKGARGRRRRRGGRGQAVCQRTHKCPYCSTSFVRPDSLRSHMRLHPISPPPEETTEFDIPTDAATSHCQPEVQEDPTPIFFTSSDDCPESLMPLVQDGTIHYIEDTSFL